MATIPGTPGNDTIFGTDEGDLIQGGAGNDEIYGGAGNDTIEGGEGDDNIFGGEGDDSIDGGAGNDIMTGGAGSDTMIGGDGDDQFYGLTIGDVIDGGEGFDRMFTNGLAPEGGRYEIQPSDDDATSGLIAVYDSDDKFIGKVKYNNIDKIDEFQNTPPCFTPGTLIVTARGEVKVEDLRVGDRVITRDSGIQEIRWIGRRDLSAAELSSAPHLRPVLIQAGALGGGLPERDLLVSPNHRVLMASDRTALYFDDREVLVAAKHLTGMDGVDVVEVSGTTYIHIMFDRHEVILSDGSWTESFQPGDQSLAGIADDQRVELLELFPELATAEGIEGYGAARRSLKPHEARLLAN
jgi:hypothetical protein